VEVLEKKVKLVAGLVFGALWVALVVGFQWWGLALETYSFAVLVLNLDGNSEFESMV
jgi:hypothetical protein